MSTNQLNHNKFRFILLRGVLGWGIPTAIIFQLIMHLTGDRNFFDGLISSLIIFPISGIFFGYFLWKAKSRKLLKQ
jgi:hypothetical protein|tara:strand:- start:258 stop:485 length:228 start_codon:yes stop_codon:yes gene_type:complete